MKTADWTKVSRETLQYCLSNVRPGAPLLIKMRALFDTAVSRNRNTPNIVQILCERGADIPLLARTLNIAQGSERFYTTNGASAAVEIARKRSRKWFDLALVKAFLSVGKPFTCRHLNGVAAAAVEIGRRLGTLLDDELTTLHRSALWQDIGKLGVSNTILDNWTAPGTFAIERRNNFRPRRGSGGAGHLPRAGC